MGAGGPVVACKADYQRYEEWEITEYKSNLSMPPGIVYTWVKRKQKKRTDSGYLGLCIHCFNVCYCSAVLRQKNVQVFCRGNNDV